MGRNRRLLDVCDSTQEEARKIVAQGNADLHGWVVCAEKQEAGRGRQGRAWLDTAGKSLLFSLILARDCERLAPIIALALPVALHRAFGARGLACVIKWPNDVLDSRGRKIAGILVERLAAPPLDALIAGMGINANQRAADFTPELRDCAASLAMNLEAPVSREALLADILLEIEQVIEMPRESVCREWKNALAGLHERARLRQAGETIEGIVEDFAPDGALVLRLEDNCLRRFYSGDVELVRFAGAKGKL